MDELEANIAQALPSALKMALYAANKQHLELLKFAIEGMDSLGNNAAFLKDLGDDSQLQTLDETAKGFVQLETQVARYKKQLQALEPLVESGTLDQKKIDKLLKDSLVKPRVNAAGCTSYKKFCERAGIELAQDENEDVVFQESESVRSTICPVTQMEMVDPLRNPACGHTYSAKGIEAHLRRSRKCPVAGCPQKLEFARLERDVEMEVFLDNRRRAEQSQAATAPGADEDDDEEEYVVE